MRRFHYAARAFALASSIAALVRQAFATLDNPVYSYLRDDDSRLWYATAACIALPLLALLRELYLVIFPTEEQPHLAVFENPWDTSVGSVVLTLLRASLGASVFAFGFMFALNLGPHLAIIFAMLGWLLGFARWRVVFNRNKRVLRFEGLFRSESVALSSVRLVSVHVTTYTGATSQRQVFQPALILQSGEVKKFGPMASEGVSIDQMAASMASTMGLPYVSNPATRPAYGYGYGMPQRW